MPVVHSFAFTSQTDHSRIGLEGIWDHPLVAIFPHRSVITLFTYDCTNQSLGSRFPNNCSKWASVMTVCQAVITIKLSFDKTSNLYCIWFDESSITFVPHFSTTLQLPAIFLLWERLQCVGWYEVQHVIMCAGWGGSRRVHTGGPGWRWCHAAGCVGSGTAGADVRSPLDKLNTSL